MSLAEATPEYLYTDTIATTSQLLYAHRKFSQPSRIKLLNAIEALGPRSFEKAIGRAALYANFHHAITLAHEDSIASVSHCLREGGSLPEGARLLRPGLSIIHHLLRVGGMRGQDHRLTALLEYAVVSQSGESPRSIFADSGDQEQIISRASDWILLAWSEYSRRPPMITFESARDHGVVIPIAIAAEAGLERAVEETAAGRARNNERHTHVLQVEWYGNQEKLGLPHLAYSVTTEPEFPGFTPDMLETMAG